VQIFLFCGSPNSEQAGLFNFVDNSLNQFGAMFFANLRVVCHDVL
jgi:hypothetical protein